MNYPKILQFKELANRPYMPSNGTEGMYFTNAFCENCINQHPDPENDLQCSIHLNSLLRDSVNEWTRDDEGYPFCSSFVKWDWGKGDDRDGWNEPPDHPPINPDQLWIPFDALELFGIAPDQIVVSKRAIYERSILKS